MTAGAGNNERWSGCSPKNGVDIVQRQHAHCDSRLYRGATDVRKQKGVSERQISRIQVRLAFERVQSRRCDLTALKSGDEILIRYHSAPRSIDNDRAMRQARNRLGIEEMVRLFCF